ncbi:hypothetical protein EHI47_33980 [Rhizobium leguminosarum]|uniref:Uncharacterized protein n=2 Tax=Rhizobium TaxID=379 RepID=A0A444HKE1_RHILE|nr:hypothetical protein [Rhizobium leguminosarum]NKL65833.1 hypothetical protein [Rhizobium leguminosarum bv. viciae]TBE72706.1 hypothetical protein ELH03_19015 [Rhizobium beringeri]RWX06569.1 hypothetical protein EHI45_27165 [Rhizobium leguminosarum]RWX22270.1 hypothetical protein EHI47_33980 [Rhizobium leguminosarum]TAU54781.1 hypothetical protein ELI43_19130 [Rhizobium leguminosarum]
MTDIRRRWQQSEDGAAKAAPFSLQVTAYSSKRVAAYSAARLYRLLRLGTARRFHCRLEKAKLRKHAGRPTAIPATH